MISKATLKTIDPIVRTLSGDRLYTSYTISNREFVGYSELTPLETRETLIEHGYEASPTFMGIKLEAAKTHPATGETHDFSVRKVDPENHRKQIHVHGWYRVPRTHIAAHREYRPDLCRLEGETLADMKTRLETHYAPSWGAEYELGVMDPALEGLINE